MRCQLLKSANQRFLNYCLSFVIVIIFVLFDSFFVLITKWVYFAPVTIFAGERDPKKRKVKPVEQPLFDLDLESSDDSDFDPDEHKEVSDDSIDSNDEGGKKGEFSFDNVVE